MKTISIVLCLVLASYFAQAQERKLEFEIGQTVKVIDSLKKVKVIGSKTQALHKQIKLKLLSFKPHLQQVDSLKAMMDWCFQSFTDADPGVKQHLKKLRPTVLTAFYEQLKHRQKASPPNAQANPKQVKKLNDLYGQFAPNNPKITAQFTQALKQSNDSTRLQFIAQLKTKDITQQKEQQTAHPYLWWLVVAVVLLVGILLFLKLKKMENKTTHAKGGASKEADLQTVINRLTDVLKSLIAKHPSESKRDLLNSQLESIKAQTQGDKASELFLNDLLTVLTQNPTQPPTEEDQKNQEKLAPSEDKKAQLDEQIIAKPPSKPAKHKQSKAQRNGQVNSSYLFAEVMLTAGPRKRYSSEANADKDLGEDVSGVANLGNEAFFWVLDGTSDEVLLKHPTNKKEYFSSRLLAQSLAFHFQQHFMQVDRLEDLVNFAIDETKKEWNNTLSSLPTSAQEALKTQINEGMMLRCSTTLMLGTLNVKGHFRGYRTGDSKMLLFQKQGAQLQYLPSVFAQEPEQDDDRLFFVIGLDAQDKLYIAYNPPKYKVKNLENIHTVFAMSDGVGAIAEQQLKHNYPKASETIRKELPKYPNKTSDDKSLCILEIRE